MKKHIVNILRVGVACAIGMSLAYSAFAACNEPCIKTTKGCTGDFSLRSYSAVVSTRELETTVADNNLIRTGSVSATRREYTCTHCICETGCNPWCATSNFSCQTFVNGGTQNWTNECEDPA